MDSTKEMVYKKWIIRGVSAFVALIIILLINPFVIVHAGQRGVVLNWGAVSGRVMGEGLHLKIPIMQKIEKINVQTVKYEAQSSAYSKDLQTVTALVALNYHVNPEGVNTLFQQIGKEYEVRIIDPAIQESIKAVSAKFTAQELIEQREQVKEEIKVSLAERLTPTNIIVDEFSIVNFDFSDSYEQAVEAKQVAQQNALKAENDLQRIKVEAEARVAEAQGEAEAIRIQAQAITQQGGEDYVKLKWIEKWNGQMPTYSLGESIPLINL